MAQEAIKSYVLTEKEAARKFREKVETVLSTIQNYKLRKQVVVEFVQKDSFGKKVRGTTRINRNRHAKTTDKIKEEIYLKNGINIWKKGRK